MVSVLQIRLNESTVENVVTVGNGEFAFTMDLTGLQSLNASYHLPGFPLYTQSNWGWHTPDPAAYGVNGSVFNPDGTLNYQYQNVRLSQCTCRKALDCNTFPAGLTLHCCSFVVGRRSL